ncbi:MAG TPA: hypothetical protein VFG11_10330, partial [Acidobacteriota bacterium]|nr:hypothetical protein [Acidobacteriota bacterium]
DKRGHEVRFSLMTNAGNTIRTTESNLIAGDLRKLGMQVDFSAVESKAFTSRAMNTYDFDAILLGLGNTDIDPSSSMDLWLSDGTLHLWWPQQKEPHTPWEKRIDELMHAQMTSFDHTERKKAYDEVQQILADQLPIIFTTYQMIHVCGRQNLGNFKPAIARDRVLWNADELFWSKP